MGRPMHWRTNKDKYRKILVNYSVVETLRFIALYVFMKVRSNAQDYRAFVGCSVCIAWLYLVIAEITLGEISR